MFRKTKITSLIAEIAIMSALGFVLDELGSALFRGLFPMGGSITIAMVVIFVVGLRRGFVPALITGFIMGALDAITGPYLISTNFFLMIFQLFLDYLFAYVFVAIGTLFVPLIWKANKKKDKIILIVAMVLVGGFTKYFAHYLSGVLFFSDPNTFAWGLSNLSPYLYSLLYNGAYLLPSIALSLALLITLYLTIPFIFFEKKENKTMKEVK